MKSEYTAASGKEIYKGNGFSEDTDHWFAASNSKNGFISYFGDVFEKDSGRIFILGGGPGVGKSTILKTIARAACERGLEAEQFHCSSSPFSLDGVRIPDLSVSVIDGTAPHTFSPKFAGVRDFTVDLQACWNLYELSKRTDEILSISKSKSECYKRAYRYLAAAGKVCEERDSIIKDCILFDKLDGAVSRIVARHFVSAVFDTPAQTDIRLQSALSGDGIIYFDNFSGKPYTNYRVSDTRGIAHYFFDMLLRKTKYRTKRCTVSYSPYDPQKVDGVFFPDEKLSFSVFTNEFTKSVNCERFFCQQSIKNVKEKYAFTRKLSRELVSEALRELKGAGELHSRLEGEYSPCTDYKAVSGVCKRLLSEIFSN